MPGEFARVLAANAAKANIWIGATAPLSATAYNAVWTVARTLRWFFKEAVEQDDVEIVRYILEVAHTDVLNPRNDEGFTLPQCFNPNPMTCWYNYLMSTAAVMDYRVVGQLLRTFALPIRGEPSVGREEQEEEIRAVKEWLGPPHPRPAGCLGRPRPHSRSAQHDCHNRGRNLPSVAANWPAEARSPVPRRISHPVSPLGNSQRWIDLGRLVEQYDHRVRLLRRVEARESVEYHWQKVRAHVVLRILALHWQERTQMALAAPGGAGRKRDLAAFQEDFAGA